MPHNPKIGTPSFVPSQDRRRWYVMEVTGYDGQWLLFTGGGAARRLWKFPADWHNSTESELAGLWEEASDVLPSNVAEHGRERSEKRKWDEEVLATTMARLRALEAECASLSRELDRTNQELARLSKAAS